METNLSSTLESLMAHSSSVPKCQPLAQPANLEMLFQSFILTH